MAPDDPQETEREKIRVEGSNGCVGSDASGAELKANPNRESERASEQGSAPGANGPDCELCEGEGELGPAGDRYLCRCHFGERVNAGLQPRVEGLPEDVWRERLDARIFASQLQLGSTVSESKPAERFVGVDLAGSTNSDRTVYATIEGELGNVVDDGQISAEEVAAGHVATMLRTKLHRPEDNYRSPTEAALALRPAPQRPTARQVRTVEAFNNEPAFREPCQIPTADIEPVSRRKSRLPAYQREGKRARAVGRAVLRQIEADKRKAEKAARRAAAETIEIVRPEPGPIVDLTGDWATDRPRINPTDHEPEIPGTEGV